MKKGRKRWMTLPALVLAAVQIAGCSSGGGPYRERTCDLPAAEVESIRVEVKDRRIEITESPDDSIHIVCRENDKEFYTIQVSEDRELSMESATDKDWTDYIGGKASAGDRTIRLSVPSGKIQNLRLVTSNEDLTLPGLKLLGALEIEVNHGTIRLNGPDVGSAVRLTVKNGDITGTLPGSSDEYEISGEAHKGESLLPPGRKGAAKTLEAYSNHGDIRLEFTG